MMDGGMPTMSSALALRVGSDTATDPNLPVPLTNDELARLISAEVRDAEEYLYGVDNIAADRDRNYDYYRGIMRDLNAPAGRSTVIDTTVADYIGLLKPDLLRVFTASQNIGEFVSPKEELQDIVKLITRYINDVVIRKDNRGEALLWDWADDALVQKLGTVMWYWEDSKETQDEVRSNLSDQDMQQLAGEIQATGAQIIEHTQHMAHLTTPMGNVALTLHSVKLRKPVNTSKCCIEALPPEEFIINRDARNFENARLKAHRCGIAVGELMALGYPEAELDDLPTWTNASDPYLNRTQKYTWQTPGNNGTVTQIDKTLRRVQVFRGIVKCNYDGTGLKDWYFLAAGTTVKLKILAVDQYNYQIGFAGFCPEPLPHTVYGRCPADRLTPIQKKRTVLERQALDNLYLSNTPQREVVMLNLHKPDQLMNMSPGAPVMVKAINSIREMSVPFVAGPAVEMIKFYEGQSELTSGVGRTSAGLDPQVLQNQSGTAAANLQSNMKGRVEMYARVWAQGGMRELFRGVFRCVKNYQDFARVVQIDGKPQTVDPKTWDGLDDLDVNINTGLGTGSRERDFNVLSAILGMQKDSLQTLGPSPIVDFQNLANTLRSIAEAAGISYPENYFGEPKNPDGSPWTPPPPPPPQPSPDAMVNATTLLKIESTKIQSDERKKLAEIASNERIKMYDIQVNAVLQANNLGIETSKVLVQAASLGVDAEKIRREAEADLNAVGKGD